jgi:hypothetical protein
MASGATAEKKQRMNYRNIVLFRQINTAGENVGEFRH